MFVPSVERWHDKFPVRIFDHQCVQQVLLIPIPSELCDPFPWILPWKENIMHMDKNAGFQTRKYIEKFIIEIGRAHV